MLNTRRLALAGVAGCVLTALLAAIGQVDPDPQLSHTSLTVSDFAAHDRGGATDTAMVVFGVSAFALLAALRPNRLPTALLALFGTAMTVAALFPTDLGPLSATGYVHRHASMLAFVALPLAALALRTGSRAVRWTVAASGLAAAAMLASATLADRQLIGAIERYLLLAEVLLLGLLCLRATATAAPDADPAWRVATGPRRAGRAGDPDGTGIAASVTDPGGCEVRPRAAVRASR